jgi:hypothetical protein
VALQPASSELIQSLPRLHSGVDEMFAEHFHLQIPRKFFIGQSLTALALFVVAGTKVSAGGLR